MGRGFWTDDRVLSLRDLWERTALPASKIAERLGGGCTRDAVIGKANRLKLAPRAPSAYRKKARISLTPLPAPRSARDIGRTEKKYLTSRPPTLEELQKEQRLKLIRKLADDMGLYT